MKYSKIGTYGLVALVLILLAAAIRLVLISLNWPLTNSDEGTIGIMALHIAYNGAHPIFFYGQGYMGAWEAYLGAALFHLFGPSLFTLRLGLVLMFVLFLTCMYLLTKLLYSKGLAIVTLLFLGLGSGYVMARELSAIGGYCETLFFGALLFVLASWLTRSYTQQRSRRQALIRLLAYLGWGLVAGLGLWTDMLSAPFILMSGILMLIFCWREWLRIVAPFGILAGLLTGILPMLLYNVKGSPYGNSLSTLLGQAGSGSTHTLTTLVQSLQSTINTSIPMMTGEPFCPVMEISFLGPDSPHTPTCTLLHWSWGIGYLLLLITALIFASVTVWHTLKASRRQHDQSQHDYNYQELVRFTGRLALLVSGLLTLVIYIYSNASIAWPGIHARYLIGLLIITPTLFAPLWQGVVRNLNKKPLAGTRRNMILATGSGFILVFIGIFFVIGVFEAFGEVPSIAQNYQADMHLAQDLEHLGIKHAYTDYWTCDKLAFLSNEQIICGIQTEQLIPTHNRYMPYYAIVSQDPASAYVFPITSNHPGPPSKIHFWDIEKKLKVYRRYIMDGYAIYLPG
jgi:hypothetical protein